MEYPRESHTYPSETETAREVAAARADTHAQPVTQDLSGRSQRGIDMDPRAGLYDRTLTSSGRRRHSSGSREAKLKRRLLVARLYGIAVTAVGVGLAIVLIRSHSQAESVNYESDALASELNRAHGELQQTKQLVAAQEVELSALIKQRIPGVSKLEIDKLYDINQGYFKKISFTESGLGADKRLAYYAVLKNTETAPITPGATILVFDRKGLQTGLARIKRDAATPPVESDALQPGETRAYSAPVEMLRADAPHYFLVEAR